MISNIVLLGSDSDSYVDVGPRLPSVACRGPKPPEGQNFIINYPFI